MPDPERRPHKLGKKFVQWSGVSSHTPANLAEVLRLLLANRSFSPVDRLEYGDHGMDEAVIAVSRAIAERRRIALYADYDVDGTMSCVSWIWFFAQLVSPISRTTFLAASKRAMA